MKHRSVCADRPGTASTDIARCPHFPAVYARPALTGVQRRTVWHLGHRFERGRSEHGIRIVLNGLSLREQRVEIHISFVSSCVLMDF